MQHVIFYIADLAKVLLSAVLTVGTVFAVFVGAMVLVQSNAWQTMSSEPVPALLLNGTAFVGLMALTMNLRPTIERLGSLFLRALGTPA